MASNSNQVIDANVWIAYLDQDDSQHTRAKKLIKTPEQPNLLLFTDYILQEVITIFLYRNKINLVNDLITLIDYEPFIEVLSIDNSALSQILQFIADNKYLPKMSLTDWSLLFLVAEFDLQLLTFDKQLLNAYRRLIS